jgi:hypothetical protein
MPRVIQDSEDEDEFDVTSPTASPISVSAPSPGIHAPTSRSKSTNETGQRQQFVAACPSLNDLLETLRQEIHAVQQELTCSLSQSNDSSHPPPNDTKSSRLHSSIKRRKTSAAGQKTLSSPSGNLERRKSVKTYGNSRGHPSDIFSREFAALTNLNQAVYTDSIDSKDVPKTRIAKEWDLSASIRDDFVQHEPVSMFPDASSTVPDNTFTQKRIIEEALTADQLLPLPNPQIRVPQESSAPSVNWEEYMATGTVSKYSTSDGLRLKLC